MLAASPVAAQVQLTVAGPAVTVFSYAKDSCDAVDIPDAPARAIRTRDGRVQLYATHFINRRLTGETLLSVRQDCGIVFRGAEKDTPQAFDDRSWLTALYTSDGVTVHAVVHTEFQGNRRPPLCPSGRYMDCWYNALTSAISADGGHTYVRPATGWLVAALPYRYDEVGLGHHGYFNPSNIVSDRGHLYMFTFATRAGAQDSGNCLLRTGNIADAGAWRGWNGDTFSVRFINPYDSQDAPGTHVCNPVAPASLRWPVTSLVRLTSGVFVALMLNAAHDGGVFAASSADLLHWSVPTRILVGLGEGAWHCDDPPPLAYPSLLDPDSPGRNFEFAGASTWLFLTRFNSHGCNLGMDRDLIRLHVEVSGKP
jgi:hypothetical protein